MYLEINFPFSPENNNPERLKHGRRMIKNYKKGCLLDELSFSVENNNLEERLSRKIRSLNFANVFTLPWFLVKI
jgi:hypothetical protein